MSFRKEKKYRLSRSDLARVKQQLFESGMTELYPSRVVTSCYFDTPTLDLFHDSEEGVLPRKKVRVRWYNHEGSLTKETKVSAIEGRFKYTEKCTDSVNLKNVVKLEFFDQLYGRLTPSLFLSYDREYDQNITYEFPRSRSRPRHIDQESVMEVKVGIDCEDDFIEQIIPWSTARFSKYSRGLLLANQQG